MTDRIFTPPWCDDNHVDDSYQAFRELIRDAEAHCDLKESPGFSRSEQGPHPELPVEENLYWMVNAGTSRSSS